MAAATANALDLFDELLNSITYDAKQAERNAHAVDVNKAVHVTQHHAAIEADQQLKPKIETNTPGFGSHHRSEDVDQQYVFFNLGDSSCYIAKQTKTFVFDLDRLIRKYNARVRFEDPTRTRELNKLANTNFNANGVTGKQAQSMITKAQRYTPKYLSMIEVVVKGSVDLSDVVSVDQID